jgi:hypothetical protein
MPDMVNWSTIAPFTVNATGLGALLVAADEEITGGCRNRPGGSWY